MSNREFDVNGWYEVKNNPISKSGVFQYLGKNISEELEPDRIYNVWRPEEELNNQETIDSFKLVPWIPHHEMLGEGFTPAEDVGVQGTTGEQIHYSNGKLLGNIKVYGEKLAKMIQDGIKELSLGFRCKWVIESGTTPSGEAYDVVQKEIRGNHLASVPSGRMGADVAVMDHSVFALDQDDVVKIKTKPKGDSMELEELIELVKKQGEQITALTEAIGTLKGGASEDMEGEAEDMDKGEKGEEGEASDSAIDVAKAVSDLAGKVDALGETVKTIQSSALDANTVMKSIAEKTDLADQAASVVGAFDHSDMDQQGVAAYALKKIGIACDSGAEVATLKGYLQAKKQPTFIIDDHAQDGKEKDISYLKALDL